MLFQLLSFAALIGSAAALPATPPESVPVTFVNQAGVPIEVFWVDTFSNKKKKSPALVAQTDKPLRNGSDTIINSFNSHTFRIKPHKALLSDAFADFVKGPKAEKAVVSFDGTRMTVQRLTRFDEVVQDLKGGMTLCGSPTKDGFHECLADSVFHKTQRMIDQTAEITKYRDIMSERLRNYTCSDPNMNTTTSLSSQPLMFQGKQYIREVLLDKPHAKIWYVRDLISPEECAVLRTHGKPRLSRATVAAADGSSVVSEHRKANQAHYDINKRGGEDPLGPLYDRVLHITNKHAAYDLTPDGQEDYTIIQYNMDDEYTPHCDGSCDGSSHVAGGRIATAVMYCEVPKVGGATTFTKADVFVKPEVEHSGCPVVEGEKWITTAWMRKGVSKAQSWKIFDPSGGRIPDEHEL